MWEEDVQIKVSYKNDEERHNAMHHENTQVSCRKGKGSQKVWQWLDRQWTRILPRIAHDLQGTHFKDVWDTLQEHWKLYQKTHYARDDSQFEELREPEEEFGASDKDDWQIEMPDGDEIHDIEEACVDEDSPPPKNRQRLSC